MQKFTVTTPHGTYNNCFLEMNTYAVNKRPAISVWSADDGPIASLTTNVRGIHNFAGDCSAVDTNNAPWAPALINKLQIGKPTGHYVTSGFCACPVYKFDLERIAEMCS